MLLRVLSKNRPWVLRSLACLFAAACANVSAVASDPETRYFVMRDGRKVPIVRSTTELGVTFRTLQDAPAAVERLRTVAGGKVEDFNGERNIRLKVLRVPIADAATRALTASDPAVESVHAAYRFRNAKTPVIGTGTLLARVKANVTEAQREALWNDYGVTVEQVQPGQPDTYILTPSQEDEVLCAEKMAADPRTVWSQPNFRAAIERRQIVPSDEYFDLQWHLHNTVTPGADIQATDAWVIANGQDIIVGMFDDGCDVDHPDLRAGYIGIGHDPSFASTNPGFEDPRPKQPFDNHGTRVMGLAVARANTIGGRGVAYQSRFTASRGLSSDLSYAEVALAYVFARQQKVDVHINSWGFVEPMPIPAVIEDQIEFAFTAGRNLGDLDGDDEEDPRGMVILFAAGNSNVENIAGFELSTLPWVIAVGASHDGDGRASYSNFGESLNFMAPSWANFRAGLFTTDNRDDADIGDPGANVGGINEEIGATEIDKTGYYTQYMSGTSGACPIAAGVAALVLSVNPLLTADEVRIVMEHTCDQIDPGVAAYNGITSRSFKYGFGRVNAYRAVLEAERSKRFEFGQSSTWPDVPADVTVSAVQLRWRQNTGTDEFLVLQSDEAFSFVPVDGKCYHAQQISCSGAPLEPLPPGVSVLAIGCEFTCGTASATCELAAEQCVEFLLPAGKKYFGLYARSVTGRYSFGVAADSDGNVTDSGIITSDPFGDSGGGGTGGGSTGGGSTDSGPAVTIRAVPLEGDSPLSVQFHGNAVSTAAIDDNTTAWDFDTGDGTIVDSTNRTTVHTYTVPVGQTRTFEARLTMCDVNKACDADSVFIRVRGPESEATGGSGGGTQAIRVKVGTLANPDADVTSGTSPVSVLLAIDSSSLSGTLESIVWDLGDGTKATSLSVPHKYINLSDRTQRVVITANITTRSALGLVTKNKATRFLTIKPGSASADPGDPNLPGAGAGGGGSTPIVNPCGTTGMIPLLGMVVVFVSMMLVRKRYGT